MEEENPESGGEERVLEALGEETDVMEENEERCAELEVFLDENACENVGSVRFDRERGESRRLEEQSEDLDGFLGAGIVEKPLRSVVDIARQQEREEKQQVVRRLHGVRELRRIAEQNVQRSEHHQDVVLAQIGLVVTDPDVVDFRTQALETQIAQQPREVLRSLHELLGLQLVENADVDVCDEQLVSNRVVDELTHVLHEIAFVSQRLLALILQKLEELRPHRFRPDDKRGFVEIGVQNREEMVHVLLQQQTDQTRRQQRRQNLRERHRVVADVRQELNDALRERIVAVGVAAHVALRQRDERRVVAVFDARNGSRNRVQRDVRSDRRRADRRRTRLAKLLTDPIALLVEFLLARLFLVGVIPEEKRNRGNEDGHGGVEERGFEGCFRREIGEVFQDRAEHRDGQR